MNRGGQFDTKYRKIARLSSRPCKTHISLFFPCPWKNCRIHLDGFWPTKTSNHSNSVLWDQMAMDESQSSWYFGGSPNNAVFHGRTIESKGHQDSWNCNNIPLKITEGQPYHSFKGPGLYALLPPLNNYPYTICHLYILSQYPPVQAGVTENAVLFK